MTAYKNKKAFLKSRGFSANKKSRAVMTLPLLLSVPHAGLTIPPEVENLCVLTKKEIIEDGDEGAARIYLPLQKEVYSLVTTDVARAIVDMNRAEEDKSKDGIVKTHTCWDVPVYREFPP